MKKNEDNIYSKKYWENLGIIITDRSIRLANPDEVIAKNKLLFSDFIKRAIEVQKKVNKS